MKKLTFSLPDAVDMNRYNFKHLPEVILAYEKQLKHVNGKEADRLNELIKERKSILNEYKKEFPEGPL